jgi:hypothetical protein
VKTATYYRSPGGEPFTVEYDETAPCVQCGLPVVTVSMGGTAVCPWCDLGQCRFSPCGRVDAEFDHETGRFMTPRKHYAKYHAAEVAAGPPGAAPSPAGR